MTVAQALCMPRKCPCGGEYLLVSKGSGTAVSLMHKKPVCAAYDRLSSDAFLAWVQGTDGKPPCIDSLPTSPEGAPRPSRRQRRAVAAVKRREAKRRGVSLKEIRADYEAAVEGDDE